MARFLALFIFLFCTILSAQFNWQDDGTPIRQGLHIEWQRTGDANSDGSMIYAWSDCRNGIRDVIIQKVDQDGNNLWGDNGIVVVSESGRQEDPQLVADGAGGAYIIWMDYRDENDAEGDIYAQHVSNNGNFTWSLGGIALTNQEGRQVFPNICSDGAGGAYVIWNDFSSSSYGDIYATHLSTHEIISEGSGVPIISYSSYRSNPSLTTGGSGDAVLVWSDSRNSDQDLYGQRISVAGSTISTQWGVGGGKLICNASGNQTRPRAAQYGEDHTIITWEDERNGSTDVYYQILDENGDGQLAANGGSACAGGWESMSPRVKAENFVAYIVWEDQRNGWTSDIYAQKINLDGSIAWGDNGLPISISTGSQTEPRLTTDGNGGVYFIWEDERNADNTSVDIYAQHIDIDGMETYETDGILICDAENMQFKPLIQDDGTGGAIVIWGDRRYGGSYGIYIQHLNSYGNNLASNGIEIFFGIATDSANEPYEQGIVYMGNDESLVYWQDDRQGEPKIFGTILSSSFDGNTDYFSNPDINGKQLTSFLELAQTNPKAIRSGNNIFLSFKVEETPNENVYLQILDRDLNFISDAISLGEPETSKQGFEMVYGQDEYVYYAYSENYEITITKFNESGEQQWSVPAVANSLDNVIKSIHPYPGAGCVIIYESNSFIGGSNIHALAIDGTGQIQNGWPVNLSDLPNDQYYENSVATADGIVISFSEDPSFYHYIYGQYLLFDGSLNFSPSGVPISYAIYGSHSTSISYDRQDELFLCYDANSNIQCNSFQLSTQSISDLIIISEGISIQEDPNVYFTGYSYLIVWEDARNSVPGNEKDIYIQEYRDNGSFAFIEGGEALCSFSHRQEDPIISKYSHSGDFVILWEDYRSTGKEFCKNLYGQSYSTDSCPALGDLNWDGTWNVLDLVQLAACVLNQDCADTGIACAADLNEDGTYNILDLVRLANCILDNSCDTLGIGQGRLTNINDASESKLILRDNHMYIEANGFIGGVQMTLKHADDFAIELTDKALLAEYLTSGNETRLLVVTPETEEIFTCIGNFEITEVIVANSYAEIIVDMPFAGSFNLSDAYPNPFNPATNIKFELAENTNVILEVYDISGRLIKEILNSDMDAGYHAVVWNAENNASGIYFVKMIAGEYVNTQKLMLMK